MEMKERSIQYNILKREADTNKELYKGLLQRMKEAGVSAGLTVSNIQVVDQAEIPTRPYKPNRQLNLLLAAVVGLFLGVGLAFFFEYLDNTVKTPEDVEQLIRLPSFGMVPEISYERKRRLEKGASYPVELITHGHPKSMLSEAYRNIRTSILLSFSEKPPKKIVITSPNPSEGKTTTVINTAVALSQTGAKVLIIDGDMRHPRIHKIFNQENGAGLSNFLSGNAPLDSIIKQTQVPNLYYIPCGPIPPNPSELVGSNLFKEMIKVLGNKFDHVVLDSPPALGFADSTILSTCVDGVVLVVLGGKTPRETLQRAKEILHQVNAKILGVVVNRVDIRRSDYGYYYYRHHYYYGDNGKKKQLPYSSEGDSAST
jgi:capsular exopolysaccharide synthesis family protein